eukprot:5432824-Pyramimonas_sp.AAC.1
MTTASAASRPAEALDEAMRRTAHWPRKATSPLHSAKASPPRSRPSKATVRRHATSTQPASSARQPWPRRSRA